MPPAARGMSASERPRPVLRPASESPRRHWTGATNRRECFSARGHREPLPPTSPRDMPQSARASSSYSAVRPGSSVSFHAAGGLSSPRGGRSGAQQHHVPPIVRTISDQKGAQTSQAAKAAHAASANQTLLLGQPGQLSSYGVYSAESYAHAEKIERGELINGLDDCVPLAALRPKAQRPTVLELGPKESSIGSDLVRTQIVGTDPFAALGAQSDDPASGGGGGAEAAAGAEGAAGAAVEELMSLTREERLQRIGQQTELQKVRAEVAQAATISSRVDGHAEAAITVMREFFANRPMDVLLEVFRNQDDDRSGALQFSEFQAGLRKLHLDLSERDMKAVFNAADLDGSGEVDLDEFFNCFRTDSFPRDTFFWSKVRPRPLLGRMERVRLAQNLLAGAVIKDWTQDEIMEVVQQKVEQFSAKAIFNSLDDNRSGRVNVREFVGAMREMDIMISDEKCEQLFKDLNERVGETDRTSHISYRAFANAFHDGMHRGTSGDDAGVVKQKGGAEMLGGGKPNTTHMWRKDAGKLDSDPVLNTKYGRFGGTIYKPGEEEQDSIQRVTAMLTSPAKLAASFCDRGKLYEEEIEERLSTIKRHDQLSEWRQSSQQGGNRVSIGAAPSRNIDWHAYKEEQTHRILGPGAQPSARGALPGAPSSGQAQMAVVRAARARRARAKADREAWEREALLAQEANLRTTVAGAFNPILDSPSYIGERDRLERREQLWSAGGVEDSAKRQARRRAQHIRQSAREAALRARNEMEHRKIEMRDWHKFLARTEHANRTADWQQVVESREAESGLEKILAEPPSSEVTDKEGNLLWQSAPPHLTSHWNTISKVNRDPPARQHVKMISAYRKYFPTADKRPPTPRKPVWGGDREHPYVRESLSPRSALQSRDAQREQLLSPR